MINNTRTPYSPNPMFGSMFGFTVGDLSASYNIPTELILATSVNATSVPFLHGGNAVEILPKFSDATTTCTVTVQNSSNTVIKVFNNVSLLHEGNLFCGGYGDSFLLAGDPVTISVSNFTGSGTVIINARKVS